MKIFLLCLVLLIAFAHSSIPGDGIEGCTGNQNPFPLITTEPQLVHEVKNGKKFTIDYDGRKFYIGSFKGNAYEMGLAYGKLFKDELKVMEKQFFEWGAHFIAYNVSKLTMLPKWLRNQYGQVGIQVVKKLLDLNYIITKKYTPKRYDDQMRGIAEGSGIPVKVWRRINLVPQLLKASCSIGGWWGPATQSGQLIQLRALDWQQHCPWSRFPMITVYNSNQQGSVPFANIGWVGFLGSLTGYSSAKIGVSERLRGNQASNMTRFGKPWTYVLRDILQFSKNIDDALDTLNNTDRTCSVYFGIGSSVNNTYRLIEYSAKELNIYNDKTWKNDAAHPRTEGMIWKAYHDDRNCFANHFTPAYGKINPDMIWREVAPRSETGDSQIIVMDYAKNHIYAMYPSPVLMTPGWTRPAVRIDLNPRFEEKWNM